MSLIISIKSALNIRIANLKKEQQLKFLKQFCSKLHSPMIFSRECKSKQDCLLSALSHHILKSKFSSISDHLGSLIFSPEILTWIANCGNKSHLHSPIGYFLDNMTIVSELPVTKKFKEYFQSKHVSYIVNSDSFDFLTCNSMEPKIVYTMFAQYFDLYVWLSLVFSIVFLSALIRLKQKSDWGALVLKFVGILLNISICIGKVSSGKKWSFVHCVWFIWFFGALVLNNWYQIVVISDFIRPATVISPWDHIFSLNGFSIVTPLGENLPHLERLKNYMVFRHNKKLNTLRVQYTHEKSFMTTKTVSNGTILYESAKNHTTAVLAWGYTALGYAIWSMFGDLCAQTWRGSNSSTLTNKYGCKETSEMITSLDPVQMYDWDTIYTKIKNCDNKVAYVSKSAEIIEFTRKVNQPGRPKMFQSGNQKNGQLSQFIFWSFRVASKNDADDIHFKRLKNLVEFGLYKYLKKLTMNSTHITILGRNEKRREFTPLNLESNIASFFYMYCFFCVIICSFTVLSCFFSTLFCGAQLTCIFSSHIFPIHVQ